MLEGMTAQDCHVTPSTADLLEVYTCKSCSLRLSSAVWKNAQLKTAHHEKIIFQFSPMLSA